MKKVIVISIMSLIFLATYAQRPSKSRSTEVNDTDRKNSEMTTDHPGRVNNDRTITDKINNNKTEIHKDMEHERSYPDESRSGYDANDGRNRSVNSRTYQVERKNYNTPSRERVYREVHGIERPRPVEYRRIHHPYRAPVNIHVIWTPRMYYDYRMIYPEYRYWYYPNGYRIRTISAYDAMYYAGEIVNVYGRVTEAWYSWETDEYILYFGARFPYQDFTVIIPGHRARQFSHRPERFFEGRYIWVTGLISLNQGQPEMIVMKKHQIHLY